MVIQRIEDLRPDSFNYSDNLTNEERKALKELQNNPEIVVKKADKGGATIILDKSFYRDTLVVEGHLNSPTYIKADNNSDQKVFINMNKLAAKHKECLTKDEMNFLTKYEWKSSTLYVLPKIHKCKVLQTNSQVSDFIEMTPPKDLKGRPIIAGPTSPTQHLSCLIEKILNPIVPTLKTYIKDDWDFIRNLPEKIPFDCKLFSCDIQSLYTSIPIELGLKAIKYWITRRRDLIADRFSNEFILDSIQFILTNNNFIFDNQMYHQEEGTAMGTIVAPVYACLTIGYLEEVILFPIELPKIFPSEICTIIENYYKRYMDDGFTPLPIEVDVGLFKSCLNNLNESIKFTVEPSILKDGKQRLNFLDITVIVDSEQNIQTEIFYKETNAHDYLNYNSQHPVHTLHNIPYNLAKRIIIFTSDPIIMENHLSNLKSRFLSYNYPEKVIDRAIYNAKLQGPAPKPSSPNSTIPLLSTNFANINFKPMTHKINSILKSTSNNKIQETFKDTKIVLGLRQPKNLLRLLTKSNFTSSSEQSRTIGGLFKCKSNKCIICKSYIQECQFFVTSNGKTWEIKSHITCNSKNVIYFLKCNMCDGRETYIGKTNNLRLRTNNHITSCRYGNGPNIFDNHVFNCGLKNKCHREPFFKVFAFMSIREESKLLLYERHLQSNNYDTMNCL